MALSRPEQIKAAALAGDIEQIQVLLSLDQKDTDSKAERLDVLANRGELLEQLILGMKKDIKKKAAYAQIIQLLITHFKVNFDNLSGESFIINKILQYLLTSDSPADLSIEMELIKTASQAGDPVNYDINELKRLLGSRKGAAELLQELQKNTIFFRISQAKILHFVEISYLMYSGYDRQALIQAVMSRLSPNATDSSQGYQHLMTSSGPSDKFSVEELNKILTAACANPVLHILTLHKAFIAPIFENFLRQLAANTTLRELCLNNFGIEDCKKITDAIGKTTAIRKLVINNDCSPMPWKYVISGFPHIHCLQINRSLGVDEYKEIISALEQHDTLSEVRTYATLSQKIQSMLDYNKSMRAKREYEGRRWMAPALLIAACRAAIDPTTKTVAKHFSLRVITNLFYSNKTKTGIVDYLSDAQNSPEDAKLASAKVGPDATIQLLYDVIPALLHSEFEMLAKKDAETSQHYIEVISSQENLAMLQDWVCLFDKADPTIPYITRDQKDEKRSVLRFPKEFFGAMKEANPAFVARLEDNYFNKAHQRIQKCLQEEKAISIIALNDYALFQSAIENVVSYNDLIGLEMKVHSAIAEETKDYKENVPTITPQNIQEAVLHFEKHTDSLQEMPTSLLLLKKLGEEKGEHVDLGRLSEALFANPASEFLKSLPTPLPKALEKIKAIADQLAPVRVIWAFAIEQGIKIEINTIEAIKLLKNKKHLTKFLEHLIFLKQREAFTLSGKEDIFKQALLHMHQKDVLQAVGNAIPATPLLNNFSVWYRREIAAAEQKMLKNSLQENYKMVSTTKAKAYAAQLVSVSAAALAAAGQFSVPKPVIVAGNQYVTLAPTCAPAKTPAKLGADTKR